jgi:hypothetical protein
MTHSREYPNSACLTKPPASSRRRGRDRAGGTRALAIAVTLAATRAATGCPMGAGAGRGQRPPACHPHHYIHGKHVTPMFTLHVTS